MARKKKLKKKKVVQQDTIPVFNEDTVVQKAALHVQPPVTERPLFQNHLLKRQNINAQYADRFTPDWLTITLISIIMLFTWYRLIYRRMLQQLINSFFSMATTNQMVRDESVLLQRATFNSSIIAYLVGGLFLYQLSILYNWDHPLLMSGFLRFILFALSIVLMFSVKMIAIRLLSNIFQVDRPASTYIFTIFLFNMMAGILLLPIVILIAYAPLEYRQILMKSGLLFLASFFVYRTVRVLIIWTGQMRASVFYLFLYLCAFEIAPLLVIGKIILIQE